MRGLRGEVGRCAARERGRGGAEGEGGGRREEATARGVCAGSLERANAGAQRIVAEPRGAPSLFDSR